MCLDRTSIDSDFIISSYNHCNFPVFNLFFQPLIVLRIIVYIVFGGLPVFIRALLYHKFSFGHVSNTQHSYLLKKKS